MGTGNLPDLAAAPTKVEALTSQYNAVTDALQGHQVMRETDGTAVDDTYDIGRPSSGRPRRIYVGTGLNVNGQDIDFSAISLQTTGITSGKSKDSGFPNFLTPLGATGGATNTFTIDAATTNLVMTIDGQAYTLEADLESDDLALAPSSNNTCTVNDSVLNTDREWSKTIGEYGYYISIDNIGSEIESLTETVQCFSIANGEETEVFIARVDADNTGATNRLIPILRGIGGTDRIAFSDGDTITLLKAHYIFLDNDLTTVDTTTTYPTWSATAPTSPATGDYWWDTVNSTWKRYSGSSWEPLGRIYLGYAICDSADCLYVEHEDFNLAWNSLCYFDRAETLSSDRGVINIWGDIKVNVAGTLIVLGDISLDKDDDYASGETSPTGGWFYVYVDNAGGVFFSNQAPRKYDKRLGMYHPYQYWRCISMAYKYEDASILMFSHTPRENRIAYKSQWSNHDIGSDGVQSIGVSPIARDAEIFFDLSYANTTTLGKLLFESVDPDPISNYLFALSSSVGGTSRSYIVCRSSLFRSGVVDITQTGFNDLDCSLYAINIKF